MTDLAARWPLGDHHASRDALLAAYSSPERGYHDALHLTEVLDRLDELTSSGVVFDATVVALAAWFHDAVYDGQSGAEARSAEWATQALAGLDSAGEVARLVLLTEAHDPSEDDLAGQALCDADLAILAADPERYRDYVAGVRRDYAHVPDADFAAGRAAVLHDLAGRARLFHTPYAVEHWEPAARANLARELG